MNTLFPLTTVAQSIELTKLNLRAPADEWYYFAGYEKELDESGNKVPMYCEFPFTHPRNKKKDLRAWNVDTLVDLIPERCIVHLKSGVRHYYYLEVIESKTEKCIVRYITKDHSKIMFQYRAKKLLGAAYKMVKKLLKEGLDL